jgi:hypothetical protein
MSSRGLSVRSTRAHDLARRLAKQEGSTMTAVVERALTLYAEQVDGQEPAADFFARLSNDHGVDIDLDLIIREGRKPHDGPDL